jgi:hypothetical protein
MLRVQAVAVYKGSTCNVSVLRQPATPGAQQPVLYVVDRKDN